MVSDFPPCHFVQRPNQGYCDQVAKVLLKQIHDIEFKRVDSTFARYQALMKQGVEFCTMDLLKNPEREKFMLYSAPLYPILPIGLVMRKDKLPRLTLDAKGNLELAQLKNHHFTLGVAQKRYYGPKIDDFIKTNRDALKLYEAKEDTTLVTMLVGGRVDVIFFNPVEIPLQLAEHMEKLTFIPIANSPLLDTYLACTHTGRGIRLIQKVNAIVNQTDLTLFQGFYRAFLPATVQVIYDKMLSQYP